MPADLGAADDHVMDLVGTVGEAQVALVDVRLRQRRPLLPGLGEYGKQAESRKGMPKT